MPKYRIKRGQKHWVRNDGRGSILKTEGDIVELSEEQARTIRDKLEFVEATVEEEKETEVLRSEPGQPRLEHVGDDRYNIIHPETGQPINKNGPLSKTQAEMILKNFNRSTMDKEETEETED